MKAKKNNYGMMEQGGKLPSLEEAKKQLREVESVLNRTGVSDKVYEEYTAKKKELLKQIEMMKKESTATPQQMYKGGVLKYKK